jgi:hypothetical protein
MREYTPKQSSNVAKFEYDDLRKEIHVTFKANSYRYTHSGIKPEHFEALQKDISPGKYYWSILSKYPLVKKEKPHEHSSTAQTGR